MERPLVSIVIPVYEVDAYLDRCVASVANQTYPNLEILLIDDGSPDGCPAKCDGWALRDPRISVFHQKNGGVSMARNAGLDRASGEYLFFFDSDDYVAPDTVEKCVAKAEETGAEAVAFGLCDVLEDGRLRKKTPFGEETVFDQPRILTEFLPGLFIYGLGMGISACGKMYRRDILKNLRFRPRREVVSEDACFTMEVFAQIRRVAVVQACLYFYCRRQTSETRRFRPDRQRQNDLFLEKALELCRQLSLSAPVPAHIMARYQLYTLDAMKQVLASELSSSERRRALMAIMGSSTLRGTLSPEVLRLHRRPVRLFFSLLRMGCYPACRFLLDARRRLGP